MTHAAMQARHFETRERFTAEERFKAEESMKRLKSKTEEFRSAAADLARRSSGSNSEEFKVHGKTRKRKGRARQREGSDDSQHDDTSSSSVVIRNAVGHSTNSSIVIRNAVVNEQVEHMKAIEALDIPVEAKHWQCIPTHLAEPASYHPDKEVSGHAMTVAFAAGNEFMSANGLESWTTEALEVASKAAFAFKAAFETHERTN